ncbi:MAG: hypothetical protein RJA67_1378 [Bacteroidota bacterium]|jgi:hypothetical protein
MILVGFVLIPLYKETVFYWGFRRLKFTCNRLHSKSNFKTFTKNGRIN